MGQLTNDATLQLLERAHKFPITYYAYVDSTDCTYVVRDF